MPEYQHKLRNPMPENPNLFHFTEKGQFFKKLDNLAPIGQSPIKCILFISDNRYPIAELITQWNPKKFRFKLVEVAEDLEKKLFQVITQHTEEGETYFIVGKELPFCIVLSNLEGKEFRAMLRIFNSYYPFLSRIFLRSDNILEILQAIEKKHTVKISATKYVKKRYYVDPKTDVCYEDTPYLEVFKKVQDERLWVDQITVSIEKNKKYDGQFGISRKGKLTYLATDFANVYNLFITEILSRQKETYEKFLTLKSRSFQAPAAKLIRIKLAEDIFNTPEAGQKFMNCLNKLPNWNYSVISKRDPFYHYFIHDSITGSSYDLLVPAFNEIHIIPQLQVVPLSLNKLLSQILDDYEGVLENA